MRCLQHVWSAFEDDPCRQQIKDDAGATMPETKVEAIDCR
jgi:hypothetical protein